MAEKTKTYRKECKHCEAEIQFGVVCKDCVAEHRVCQMCNTSIVDLDDSAMVCSPKHRTSKSRAKAATEAKNGVTVTSHVTPKSASIDLFRAVGQTVETAIQQHPTVRIDNDSAKMIGEAVVSGLAPLLEEFMRHLTTPRETVTVSKSVSVPVMPNTPLTTDGGPRHQTNALPPPNFDDDDFGIDLKAMVKESKKVDGSGTAFQNAILAMNSNTGEWSK